MGFGMKMIVLAQMVVNKLAPPASTAVGLSPHLLAAPADGTARASRLALLRAGAGRSSVPVVCLASGAE